MSAQPNYSIMDSRATHRGGTEAIGGFDGGLVVSRCVQKTKLKNQSIRAAGVNNLFTPIHRRGSGQEGSLSGASH